MLKPKKKIQMKTSGGTKTIQEYNNTFFSTETSFNFDGRYITLDFKRVSPRSDGTLVIEHSPVMVDVFHAKDFTEKFSGLIQQLEKQFGNIESPEFIKKFRVHAQKQIKKINAPKENNDKEIRYIG